MMRALHPFLLVTLCLPLQAGDPADLDKAVAMFRSPHPAARAEGSRLANKELRRLLAPLLKAMRDPDPEVRRRVREAILALVPHHGREPEQQRQQNRVVAINGLQLKFFQLGAGRARIVPVPVVVPPFRLGVLQRAQAEAAAAQAALQRLGLVLHFVAVPGKRTGFRVVLVVPNSAAAKVGLIAGDTILTINKQPATSWQAIHKALGKKPAFAGSTIKVLRRGGALEICVR